MSRPGSAMRTASAGLVSSPATAQQGLGAAGARCWTSSPPSTAAPVQPQARAVFVARCPAPCWELSCWPRVPPACAKEDAQGEAVPGWLEAGKGFLAGGRHWDTTATRAKWSLQAVSVWFGKGDPVVSAEPQPWVRRALTTSVLSYERKVFYPPKERQLPMAEQSPVSPWLSLRGLRC